MNFMPGCCASAFNCFLTRLHGLSGVVLVCLLAATLATPLLADGPANHTKLRIAYVEFPPYTYRNTEGDAAGSVIDVTRKVVEEAGYHPDFIHLPVSRVYLYLSNGHIDVWPGLSRIPVLQKDVLESWASPMPVYLSAWHLKGTPGLENFHQLEGRKVIVISGYTYRGLADWLEARDPLRVTQAPNHRAGLDMLKRGRGDYLLDYREPVREILVMPGDRDIRESRVRARRVAWLFSLANPRAAVLREDLDDAYLRLLERGEVPALINPENGYIMLGFPEQFR